MKVVKVEWLDAECLEEWVERDDCDEYSVETIEPSYTLGFLVYESSTHVALAQTIDDEQAANVWKIPRGMVQRIEIIHEHETPH